jgi:hypothetical protein
MTYLTDPRVAAYIDALPDWQRDICCQRSRQRVPLRRRHRARPERHHHRRHTNKTARTVAIRNAETLNSRPLALMFRQIIANNRAGGWRKLKLQADR